MMKISKTNNYDKKLGIVCCYFNPCDYASKFLNYITFIENIKKHGVRVLTIEAYTLKSKYRIDKLNNDTISVKCNQTYWMKECLLNIGIKKMLEWGYENIAWIDADVIFKSASWPQSIIDKLTNHKVVQIFENCYEEQSVRLTSIYRQSAMAYAKKSKAPIKNILLMRKGELGYGYAYNASVLKQCLLYDKAIVGAGDFANILGCVYNDSFPEILKKDRFFVNTTSDFFSDYCLWAKQMSAAVLGSVGVVNEDILVLNHGSRLHRHYLPRETIIKYYKFKPTQDLSYTDEGIYKISQKQQAMLHHIERHFKLRNEDEGRDFMGVLKTKRQNISTFFQKIKFYDIDTNPLSITSVTSYLANRKYIAIADYTHTQCFNDDSTQKLLITKNETSLQKIDILNKSKLPLIIIISRHSDMHILNDSDIPKITFVKNGLPRKGEYLPRSHTYSTSHTYLSYIIQNYETLPEAIMFINDLAYTEDTHTWIRTLKNIKKYEPAPNRKKRIYLDCLGHLKRTPTHKKSKYDFKTWFKIIMPTANVPTYFYEDTMFAVPRNIIWKHSKSFYRELATMMPTSPECEEEHYFACSWSIIFS